MKGIFFTGFLDLVEEKFGIEMVDDIILNSTLESEGVYTSVGTYSFSEMLQLLKNLSNKSGISIDNLLLIYGEHFFSVIEKSDSRVLDTHKGPIEMLPSIENHIHVEVIKIYPDAELPTFIVKEKIKNALIMKYKSNRTMHHFGQGIINKIFDYVNTSAEIILEKIKEDDTEVKLL